MSASIQPPEGYRLLNEGEMIQEGDLCLRCDTLPWIFSFSIGQYWSAEEYYPMCRKIELKEGEKA